MTTSEQAGRNMNNHDEVREYAEEEYGYRCNICGKMFTNIKNHLKQSHSNLPEPSKAEKDIADTLKSVEPKLGLTKYQLTGIAVVMNKYLEEEVNQAYARFAGEAKKLQYTKGEKRIPAILHPVDKKKTKELHDAIDHIYHQLTGGGEHE